VCFVHPKALDLPPDCTDSILKKQSILIPTHNYLIYNKFNPNRVIFDSTKKIRIPITTKSYVEVISMNYKQYSFIIKSYYIKDPVDRKATNLFNPSWGFSDYRTNI
jgi:hypothetical protein